MVEWSNGWMDEWSNEWTHEWMHSCYIVRWIQPSFFTLVDLHRMRRIDTHTPEGDILIIGERGSVFRRADLNFQIYRYSLRVHVSTLHNIYIVPKTCRGGWVRSCKKTPRKPSTWTGMDRGGGSYPTTLGTWNAQFETFFSLYEMGLGETKLTTPSLPYNHFCIFLQFHRARV